MYRVGNKKQGRGRGQWLMRGHNPRTMQPHYGPHRSLVADVLRLWSELGPDFASSFLEGFLGASRMMTADQCHSSGHLHQHQHVDGEVFHSLLLTPPSPPKDRATETSAPGSVLGTASYTALR